MPTNTSIEVVRTDDAAPEAAPHRISAKAGKDVLTLEFRPVHDGEPRQPIMAYSVEVGGGAPGTGLQVGRRTGVCSPVFKCSPELKCGWSYDDPSVPITEEIDFSELQPQFTEGDHQVNVHVLTRGEGWS